MRRSRGLFSANSRARLCSYYDSCYLSKDLELASQPARYVFANAFGDMSLACRTFRSTDKCEFLGASTPYASECDRAARSRRRNIYSRNYICMACPFDDSSSAIGD